MYKVLKKAEKKKKKQEKKLCVVKSSEILWHVNGSFGVVDLYNRV